MVVVETGTVSVGPIGRPNGVIQAVSGSPSVAAQPPAVGIPVSRSDAVAPESPSSSAITESSARAASRSVASIVAPYPAGTVTSRTSRGSGSRRQRLAGSTRRRVKT